MPRNPWLAVDAATSPLRRARQLRAAWERFLAEGRTETVRVPVADSWRRSRAAGVDPLTDHAAPTIADRGLTSERWDAHPLASARELIRECLGPIADDADELIVVADADGMLLSIDGPLVLRAEAADSMNFTEGAGWSEHGPGTNAVGTALAADHAVQIFAAEHFNQAVHAWTCAAAPVHDPDSGRLLGAINVTGKLRTIHPDSFGLAVATSHVVEMHLHEQMNLRDAQLRARYEDELAAAGPSALLATPSGRVIAGPATARAPDADRLVLPPGGGEVVLPSGARAVAQRAHDTDAYLIRPIDERRPGAGRPVLRLRLLADQPRVELAHRSLHLTPIHTAILALLADHPDGLTTQQLAYALYGDDGRPNAVRVQIFRLRKVLGPWIDTNPYRLTIPVSSDVAQVRGLLERGDVRQAAQDYRGPLLDFSDAPGIAEARAVLDAWLRQAVLTSDDVEALWAWVRTPSGADDLPAWRRLLVNLDYEDPRRSLAASRVAGLRAAVGREWLGDRPAAFDPLVPPAPANHGGADH
jgi:Transcriptional regulatory protein, C terminal/GAF domain